MATSPINFASYYGDPSIDPYAASRHSGVLAYHSLRAPTPTQPAAVRDRVLQESSEGTPQTFLMSYMTQGATYPQILVVHKPFKFTSLLGATASSQNLAFVGDIAGNGGPPVVIELDGTAFSRATAVRVLGLDQMGPFYAGLAANTTPDGEQIPLVPDTDADSEEVQVRNLVYVPPQLAALLLTRSSHTPREAWTIVGEKLLVDTAADAALQATYLPVLDWLRATATFDANNNVVTAFATMTMPFPRSELLEQRITMHVNQAVGAQGHPPSPVGTLERAINALTSEVQKGHTEAARRHAQGSTKTPQQYYGTLLPLIYNLTRATGEGELPELFKVVAASPKRQVRIAIENHLATIALQCQMQPIVVTTRMAQCITEADFAHHYLEDLEGAGFHPFLTTYRDPTQEARLKGEAQAYDAQQEGRGATREEIRNLKELEKLKMPLKESEARHCLEDFRILLQGLLGQDHVVTRSWRYLLDDWGLHQRTMCHILEETPMGPALAVRWLQIRVSNWFTDQMRSVTPIAAPDFRQLIMLVRNRQFWQSPLPVKYQRAFQVLPRPSYPALPAPANPANQFQLPAEENSGRGSRGVNEQPDLELKAFKDGTVSIAAAHEQAKKKNLDTPKNKNGTEMCLSYHVAGFCWNSCRRSEDRDRWRNPPSQ